MNRRKVHLILTNCIIHPSMITRDNMMKKYNLRYIRKYLYSSYYDLIARNARFFPVTNMPEVLMHHRVHEGMVSAHFRAKQIEMANLIFIEQIRYIELNPSVEEKELHIKLLRGHPAGHNQRNKLLRLIEKVKKANRRAMYYDHNELESFLNTFLTIQHFSKQNEMDRRELPFIGRNNNYNK